MEKEIRTLHGTRRIRRVIVVAVLAGVVFWAGAPASPASEDTNYCNNEGRFLEGGDDLWIDVSNSPVVGIDTGGAPAHSYAVCIFNETYSVTLTTTGGVTVTSNHCTGLGSATCTLLLDRTGLVQASGPSTTVGSTTVCAGICTSVPFTPVKVDTGYDLYVDGTKVANVCLSVGTAC